MKEVLQKIAKELLLISESPKLNSDDFEDRCEIDNRIWEELQNLTRISIQVQEWTEEIQ